MISQICRIILFVSVCTAISGCITPDYIYCHDSSYTESMYKFLKDEPDYQEQLELMDKYFEKAESSGKKVAPGAYAHYALLKSKIGDEGDTLKYLEKEKTAFPDSIHYIDFLITSSKNKQQADTDVKAGNSDDTGSEQKAEEGDNEH